MGEGDKGTEETGTQNEIPRTVAQVGDGLLLERRLKQVLDAEESRRSFFGREGAGKIATALLALIVPATTATYQSCEGSNRLKLEREKEIHQMRVKYFELAAGSAGETDKQRLLRFLRDASEDVRLGSWAGNELKQTEKEISNLQAQVIDIQAAIKRMSEPGAAPSGSSSQLPPPNLSKIGQKQAELTELRSRLYGPVPPSENPIAKPKPIVADVKLSPRASYRPTGAKYEDGTEQFVFSVWLEMDNATKKQVKEVVYDFKHPSWEGTREKSSDPTTGFRASYEGYGCVTSVDAIAKLHDGRTTTTTFDQCALQKVE